MSTPAKPLPTIVPRLKALVEALAGNSFEGLRNKPLADAVKQAPSTTLRDLEALEAIGWAERLPGNKDSWRLSPRLVQIAIAHQNEIARLTQRVDDFNQRYSRSPN